jgi:hypothetical protein
MRVRNEISFGFREGLKKRKAEGEWKCVGILLKMSTFLSKYWVTTFSTILEVFEPLLGTPMECNLCIFLK